MVDIYSLYTKNGIPVANKVFEKVVFKHGLKVSPIDLIDFQDSVVRDYNNFLFATRGQLNGVYKTEYNIETEELSAGLEVSLQEAQALNPSSNYELKISKGKAYIGGKLVVLPLDDYVEIPDNDIYAPSVTLHLILERKDKYFEPIAIGEPGFAIIDGEHTSDRYEAGYILRLVENLPTDVDDNGNVLFMELATINRPTILKEQSEISLDQLDGINDSGTNWVKYESNLNILNVEKVEYLYSSSTVVKIPLTITQQQWDDLDDGAETAAELGVPLVAGVYYVPYTQNVLIIHSDVNTFSQERIWYMPHTVIEVFDMRYIMEDLPSVISAAFQAVNDLKEHRTNFFEGYVPYGLNNQSTPGSNGIQDDTTPDYNPDGKTFWTLPIAEAEPLVLYLNDDIVNPSDYVVENVVKRTYKEDGDTVIKELGKITFHVAPVVGQKLTVDFYHDSHTLYTENAKHEAHINDINAHPLYVNNNKMAEHLTADDGSIPEVEVVETEEGYSSSVLSVLAHDNRYYRKSELDDEETGKADVIHDHNLVYSKLGHEHPISEINDLQDQLVKIEDNIGVYNKTTRLIMEKVEEGVNGLRDHFIVDSILMQDETVELIGVRADLTNDSTNNPVILTLLRDPSNITGIVDSRVNNTIKDEYAIFPNNLIGNILIGTTIYTILSNTNNTITLNENINDDVIDKKYIINPNSITSIIDNWTIVDTNANFPINGNWIGAHIQLNINNSSSVFNITRIIDNHTIEIEGNDSNFDVHNYTAVNTIYLVNDFTEGGINPWSEPKKVSFGGNNLGLVVSAVQQDDEVWSLWVDTMDSGESHTLWWASIKMGEDVWSPPVNTEFVVDSDCRPSVVLLPNSSNINNEDLLWLFSNNHKVYRSYVEYGQTNYTDQELFGGGILNDVYSVKGIYINRGGVGIADEIWLVYVRDDNGFKGIFLRRFHTNKPYIGNDQDAYSVIGNEIKLSSDDKNCYFPTITQESGSNGKVWIAWGEDNSEFDNRKKPIITIIDINTNEIVSPSYIPKDIIDDLSNFNNDSKMELHYSNDGDIWFIYSVLEGGSFKVYYVLLDYEQSSNDIVNLTPPVELNWGHEVSITERSDGTIWINYNQATQVYSQVRTLGNGEAKWVESTGDLILETAPNADTFIELRWQLPFVNIESRLEYVESEIRAQQQKLEELENNIKVYHEGTPTNINQYDWELPLEYVIGKASNLRIFVNGLRLSSTDWSLNGNTITFVNSTPISSKIVIEWNQLL
jgi:hypothetical protein